MKVVIDLPEEFFERIRPVLHQEGISANPVTPPRDAAPKELLSLAECSALTGFAKSTIYKLVSQEQIPFAKKNGRLFFFHSRIEEWIREEAKEPKNALATAESHLLSTRKRKGGDK
jgi:predicted DNA-binding transcriptional regulator AlpA